MNTYKLRHITLLTLLLLSLTAHPAVTVHQELDSTWLLMGRITRLNIELLTDGDPDGAFLLDDKRFPAEVEIAHPGSDSIVDLGNGRRSLRRSVVLQSFDSGTYMLPPIAYVTPAGDTSYSNSVALKVLPAAVDTLTDIHPYAGPVDAGLRWYDRLPDWLVDWGWWVILLLLILAAAAYLYIRRYGLKAPTEALRPAPAPEPPYDAARRQLEHLREEHLWEAGHERTYYTRLTEILRVYLQRRFSINAMEMTSGQILRTLQHNEATRLPQHLMRQVLEMADFVKFAKARPLPDDNTRIWNAAMQFVEDTKPAPEPTPEAQAPAQPS